MKTLVAVMILSMAAVSAALACSENAPTRWVRVQFAPGCSVPDDSILIQVGTKTKMATKQGGYYVADFDPDRFNATYTLSVGLPTGLTFCCHAVAEVKHPTKRRDCTVDYIVSCDKPSWGVVASSDSQSIAFSYSREHPTGFGSVLCQRDVESTPHGITGLGESDTVMVRVQDGKRALVSIPVTREDLARNKGKIPLDQNALKKCLPTGKAARNGTTNEGAFIALTVQGLPKKVIVTETQ